MFPPALFTFLRELAENNERDWFNANKSRFENDVKAPLHAFVRTLAPRLAAIDPLASCDDKSVFRIYRDTRFSNDKRPYKTNAGLHFPRRSPHPSERGPSAPGYYLHLAADECFFGAGLWMPDGPALAGIRAAIDTHRARWIEVRDAAGELRGESLVRVPKGFAADHPLATDLKRKSFTVGGPFSEAEACAEGFLDWFVAGCARTAPFVGFLAEAAGG
jgi:uncharacterized protein (TIGR02453 family)